MRTHGKFVLLALLCVILPVFLLSGCQSARTDFTDLAQLNNKDCSIAAWTGTPTENTLSTYFPDARHVIADDSISLIIENLRGNKVNAVLSARVFYDAFPNKSGLKILESDIGGSYYAFIFSQTEKGEKLRDEMNEFIAEANESGLAKELEEFWMGENPVGRPIGTGSDDPDAPELVFAVEYQSPPFGYVEGNTCIGYDVDYAECFCKAYGYRLKVIGLPFNMIIAGDTTGAFDFAAGGILVDDQMKQRKVISDPNSYSPFIVIVNDSSGSAVSPLSSLSDSLNRTLIEGDRWQMYLNGLGTTLLIAVVSALVGTALGFLIYLADMKAGKWFHHVAEFIFSFIHITPTVVLLMIFYYIVFHGLDISGLSVSLIVFTLIMTGTVYELVTSSVNAVSKGQQEAAIALGCRPLQGFFRVVMPQALRHFLPLYKGSLIDLVKISSVVGYIAVQDLTKVADIIRSRTFDAFVPLFFSAVIYILLALLLIRVINCLYRITDPKNRKREKILAGLEQGKEAAE